MQSDYTCNVKTKIISPFFAYSASWMLVLFLYAFHWSVLLQTLNASLICFLLITIIVSVISLFVFGDIEFEITVSKKIGKRIHRLFLFVWWMFFIEVLFAKGVPLLHLVRGDYSYGETQFALPVIHIVFSVFSSLVCAESWFWFKITRQKKFLYYSILMFLPPILMIARSMILYNALYCFFITLSLNVGSFKKRLRKISFLIFVSICLLFLFGLAGEARSTENKTGRNMIIALAKPSESFRRLNISEIWLWPYCYITTPLDNLQHTINDENIKPMSDSSDYNFVFYHFLPELVKKRVFGRIHNKESLVVNYFNVCSIYADAYGKMGYFGMIYSFLGSYFSISG